MFVRSSNEVQRDTKNLNSAETVTAKRERSFTLFPAQSFGLHMTNRVIPTILTSPTVIPLRVPQCEDLAECKTSALCEGEVVMLTPQLARTS